MGKKILWLVVSGLMVLSLMIAACGPAEVEEKEEEETKEVVEKETEEKDKEEEVVEEEVVVSSDEPQYGGTFTLSRTSDITTWDQTQTMTPGHFYAVQEELQTGDWTKGPVGTGEAAWTAGATNRVDMRTGALAESWESPEPGHLIFHIRQGVHWALNPDSEASRLVGGRELVADDVVFSLRWLCTVPTAYIARSYPPMCTAMEMTTPDDYTVDIKVPPEQFSNALDLLPELMHIYPPEVIEKYGDMNDWKLSVGTGPFILIDVVPGSTYTYVRNSNYWGTDPIGLGKGNQLPYLDGITQLIIPDTSTIHAALRTGKLDYASAGTLMNLQTAMVGAPQLIHGQRLGHGGLHIGMRIYDENLPVSDKRVRQALMMATDMYTLRDQLYQGDAEIRSWPNTDQREYKNIFLSLEEAPASVQELYTYNPEGAQKLLTEAGYPDGFKISVVSGNSIDQVDLLAVIKDMWAEVGVELVLEPKESTVFRSILSRGTWDEMILSGAAGAIGRYYSCNSFYTPSYFNTSKVDDPFIAEKVVRFAELYNAMDWVTLDKEYKELMPYVLEQAWVIPIPKAYSYAMWWPWVKNYHGESSIGYTNGSNWVKFIWVDQDLRKQMLGE
ncbi:ABC transporter substrate-binding protein [Chloroflexota bacterium]